MCISLYIDLVYLTGGVQINNYPIHWAYSSSKKVLMDRSEIYSGNTK